MNRGNVPTVAQTTLRAFEERVEHFATRLARCEDGIASTRSRLTGAFARQSDYDTLTAALDDLVADRPILDRRHHAAKLVLSSCTEWLDKLPEGTTLEPVEVNVEGHDLAQVRAAINRAELELKSLRAIPTPSADIKERVQDYVASMGKPQISGIGRGEHIEVVWPGAGWDERGPRKNCADVPPMMALLFPEQMVAALMRQIEADPATIAARQKRISELETKLDGLQRQAIALGEEPDSDLPPAVLLGVTIVRREPVERVERRERAA